MISDLQSILDAIDAIAVHTCAQCDKPLPAGHISPYHCDEDCQRAWHQVRVERLDNGPLFVLGIELTHWQRRAVDWLLFPDEPVQGRRALRRPAARWCHPAHEFLTQQLHAAIHAAFAQARPEIERASRVLSDLAEADLIDPLPVDPQARALWLRQNRNTGPQHKRRPPSAIHPTGRGCRR